MHYRRFLSILVVASCLGTVALAEDAQHDAVAAEEVDVCAAARADHWLAGFNDRIRAHDMLYKAFVGRNGEPVTCEGRITDRAGEETFGQFIFTWKDGTKFTMQTMPPESSVVRVSFATPTEKEEILSSLQGYMASRGFHMNWSEAKATHSSHGVTEEYSAEGQGMNTFVRLKFDATDRLSEVEISSAL